jgi:hypothetical protein
VRLAWSKEALLVKWVCQDRQIKNLKTAASGRDGKVVEDDSVELVLSSGATGETWHFAVNAKGTQQDYRVSSVGVREDLWNPVWQASMRLEADRWEVDLTIPFASLGQTPNPNESWQARFLRHNGGRQDLAAASFPERDTASLLFSSAAQTDRSLLWWSGLPDKEEQRNVSLIQQFAEKGWQVHIVTDREKLLALHEGSDAYWFRHPAGSSKVPTEYWAKHLVPAVKGGALVIFSSYLAVPLDEYFADPSLKVKLVSCGKIPLAGRTTAFIAPGDWSRKPNDLLPRLKDQITPAYGFVPADSASWTVLASAANGSDNPYPYLLARRYGKGMIILGGDDIRLTPAKMLENFISYHKDSTKETER